MDGMGNCHFCNSDSIVKLGEIPQSVLMKYYRDSLGIDTSQILSFDGNPIELLQCICCDLKWYSPSPSGNQEFYEGLQQHTWYYQEEKPEYSYASKFFKSGDSLLEVGCGKGAFSKFLPQGVSYRGLEFNEEAVRKGRAAGLQVDIETVETHAMKNPEAYDVVCHFQVLEHVTDPISFLVACSKLLKPGGLLIVAVPAEDSFLSIAEGGYLNMPPHHLTRWTDKALGLAIERSGVIPIEFWHEPVAPYHRDWYQSVLGMFALRSMLGQATRLYANDVFSRLMRRLLRVKVLGASLTKYGEKQFVQHGYGHTVCVVGEKVGKSE